MIDTTMDARLVCAKVIAEVINNRKHVDHALSAYLDALKNPRDKRLARELCYGTLRWYPRLSFIASRLLRKPFKSKDMDVFGLVCSGLYQMNYLRIPDHAAISATVEAARALGKSWACDLINAVLRRYQRERTSVDNTINSSEEALYSHPQWMIALFRDEWPDVWREILQANNEYPPLQLRVNPLRQTRAAYLHTLESAGIEATPDELTATGITLSNPVNVEDIPGFLSGEVSVQDYGAQLAAILLDTAPGQRVLDACAAPGGKTGHILERTPGIEELVAVEMDVARLDRVRENIDRLGLKASLVHADVSQIDSWWDGRPFDRILLDAPCSASGVIRRHPDIKLLRTPEQIPLFTLTQSKLLDAVWPLLKPGGKLLYSTCSIIHSESDDQIATFARKYDDTEVASITAEWGTGSQCGRYLLPGQGQTDGFYYALVGKTFGK